MITSISTSRPLSEDLVDLPSASASIRDYLDSHKQPSLSDYPVKFSDYYVPESSLVDRLEAKKGEQPLGLLDALIVLEDAKQEIYAEKEAAGRKWGEEAQAWLQAELQKNREEVEKKENEIVSHYTSVAVERLEKRRERYHFWQRLPFLQKIIFYEMIFVALPFFVCLVLRRYYTLYNFAWGDYLESFRRRNSVLRTVFVVVIIGVVVSTIGGLIANQF